MHVFQRWMPVRVTRVRMEEYVITYVHLIHVTVGQDGLEFAVLKVGPHINVDYMPHPFWLSHCLCSCQL